MVNLSDIWQKITGRKEELSQAQQQITSFNPSIQQTRRQLMAATPVSQAQVRGLERMRALQKQQSQGELTTAQGELSAYEQQVQEYEQQTNAQEELQRQAAENYDRELAAYNHAKYLLESGYMPDKNAPPGTYGWYKKLWSEGYGKSGDTSYAQVENGKSVFYPSRAYGTAGVPITPSVTSDTGYVTPFTVPLPTSALPTTPTTRTLAEVLGLPKFTSSAQQQLVEQFNQRQQQYQSNIARYQTMGYTQKEAADLARYQFTPIPSKAQELLTKDLGYTPAFLESLNRGPIGTLGAGYTTQTIPKIILPAYEWGKREALKLTEGAISNLGLAKRTYNIAPEFRRENQFLYPGYSPTQTEVVVPSFIEQAAQPIEAVGAAGERIWKAIYPEGYTRKYVAPEFRREGYYQDYNPPIERTELVTPEEGRRVAETLAFFSPAAPFFIASSAARGLKTIAYPEVEKVMAERWKQYLKEPVQEGYRQLTEEEFYQQMRLEIEQQIKMSGLTEFGVSGGILATMGAIGAVKEIKWLGEDVRVRLPTAKLPRREAVEFIKPSSDINEFLLKEKITIPRRYEFVQPRYQTLLPKEVQDIFGFKPLKKTYTPPRTFDLISPSPIKIIDLKGKQEIQEPAYLLFQRKGAKQIIGLRLRSGGQVLPSEEFISKFKQMPQQRQFVDLFKSIKQTRTLKRGAEPLLILGGEQQLFIGGAEAEKFVKIGINRYPKQSYIPYGRRITSADITGIQTKIAELPKADIYAYRFSTKETTKPFMKAKYPKTKGISFVKTSFEEEPKDIISKSLSLKLKRKPSVPKEALQKAIVKAAIKQFPKPKPIKIAKLDLGLKQYPTIVGGLGTISQYAGKGTYEAISPKQIKEDLFIPRISGRRAGVTVYKPGVTDIILPKETTRTISRTSDFLVLKPRTEQRTTEILKPSLRQFEVLRNIPRISESLRTEQRATQRTVQRSMQVQRTITTPRTKTPKTPTIKIPIFELGKKPKPSKKFKDIFAPGKYIGEIRRYGKWFAVTKPVEFGTAFGAAKKKVKETLGASLRVVSARTGKLAPIPTSDMFFRPGKRSPGIAVQRSIFRLAAPTERTEIQRARRGERIPW